MEVNTEVWVCDVIDNEPEALSGWELFMSKHFEAWRKWKPHIFPLVLFIFLDGDYNNKKGVSCEPVSLMYFNVNLNTE